MALNAERRLTMRFALHLAVVVLAAGCASHAPSLTAATAPPGPSTATPVVAAPATPVVAAPATPVVAAPATPALAASAGPDAQLMLHAAQDGMAEVRLGQLAAQRASSERIRQLAQRLVADHTQADASLKALAAERGITLPQTSDPRHAAVEQELARLNGAEFDTAYLEEMIGDHARAIAMFHRIALTATDPALRDWALQQLPALQQHQAATRTLYAQAVNASVPPSASPSSGPRR
jgi:putative membrane protein